MAFFLIYHKNISLWGTKLTNPSFLPWDPHLLLGSTSQMRASGLFWGIVLFSLGTCRGV